MRELTLYFERWNINDVIVEVARYVEKGFLIVSWVSSYSSDWEKFEVTLYEPLRS